MLSPNLPFGRGRPWLVLASIITLCTFVLVLNTTTSSAAPTIGSQSLVYDSRYGRLYLARAGSPSVFAFDSHSFNLVAMIDTAEFPGQDGEITGLALNTATRRLYVAIMTNGSRGDQESTVVIDLVTHKALARLSIGGNIAVDEVRNRVYISRPDGRTSVVDGATNLVSATIPIGGAAVVDPASHRLYLARFRSVSVIDTESNQPVGLISTPFQNAIPELDAQPSRLVLTSLDERAPDGSNVVVIDTKTNAIVATANLPSLHLPVVPVGSGLLLVARSRSPSEEVRFEFYDYSFQVVRSSWPIWIQPGAIAVDALYGRILIGNTNATQNAPNQIAILSTSEGSPLGSIPAQPKIDARIEIVWPHGDGAVADTSLANVGAVLYQTGTMVAVGRETNFTARLWKAVDDRPFEFVAIGRKSTGALAGLSVPIWRFDNVDVSEARSPDRRVYLKLTVDGVAVRSNIWSHANDGRTNFPVVDIPDGLEPRLIQPAFKIQALWPHDGASVDQADRANLVVYAFERGTRRAASSNWSAVARLWRSIDGSPAEPVGLAMPTARAVNGGMMAIWEFNDVDVGVARDPDRRMFFFVTADDAPAQSNVWAHAQDARSFHPDFNQPSGVTD
ncbi:MAG TPA: hypothetical protein VMP10_05125 [Chloroflexota bacterium]|nr:hypothetical protein [Chloroflexota bacterium]